MRTYRIVDRGDGPKIEGTRITVYAIFEYLEILFHLDNLRGSGRLYPP